MQGVLSPLSRPVLWRPTVNRISDGNPRYNYTTFGATSADLFRSGKLYWEMSVGAFGPNAVNVFYLGATSTGAREFYIDDGLDTTFNPNSTVCFLLDTVTRIFKYALNENVTMSSSSGTDGGYSGCVTPYMESNADFQVTLRSLRQDFQYAVPPGFTPFGEM